MSTFCDASEKWAFQGLGVISNITVIFSFSYKYQFIDVYRTTS